MTDFSHDQRDTQRPPLDPLLKRAFDTALASYQSSLDEVRIFMRECHEEHPDLVSGMHIKLKGQEDIVAYMEPEEITARQGLLATMRDVVFDTMQSAKTPAERVEKMMEIVQGGLHASTYFPHTYEAWHLVDGWIEAARTEFMQHATPAQERDYGPMFEAGADYSELCEMAHDTIRQLLHAQQRSEGAKDYELRDSCYDLAVEHYYRHYPSRRNKELTPQEQHWVTNESKVVLNGILEPYAAGLPEGIVPEMAACIALAVHAHAKPARSHVERVSGEVAANDNQAFEDPRIQEKANATLARLFEKYPDAAANTASMVAAWRELDKSLGEPEKAAAQR